MPSTNPQMLPKVRNLYQIKSKVLFKVGTFTNSTNISSRELLKPHEKFRYIYKHDYYMLIQNNLQMNRNRNDIYPDTLSN